MEAKRKVATKGCDLLEKKADELTRRFRALLKEIRANKEAMGRELKETHIALSRARYEAGDFSLTVMEGVGEASFKVTAEVENVSGVLLPNYKRFVEGVATPGSILPGLAKGGTQIQHARQKSIGALQALIKLASQQTAFITLDEKLKVLNRRVNALKHMVIPRIENTISYIKEELEQQELEENYRARLIKKKKVIASARFEEDLRAFHSCLEDKDADVYLDI